MAFKRKRIRNIGMYITIWSYVYIRTSNVITRETSEQILEEIEYIGNKREQLLSWITLRTCVVIYILQSLCYCFMLCFNKIMNLCVNVIFNYISFLLTL